MSLRQIWALEIPFFIQIFLSFASENSMVSEIKHGMAN